MLLNLLLHGLLLFGGEVGDTLSLPTATVVSVKENVSLGLLAAPSTSFELESAGGIGIQNQHSISRMVPSLEIPDYGASLTSTIYIRGLGSRMENPSLSLYIDNIPVLDKNAYDFSWFGIHSGTLIRGPQGSLYGRNSMGGVLLLNTQKPMGGGTAAMVETGYPGMLQLGAMGTAGEEHAISGSVRLSRGYFTNAYSGKPLDPYTGGVLRWRWDRSISAFTSVSNSLHLNASREGGFAYGRYQDGEIQPVNYNDEGSYSRISLLDGFKVSHTGNHIRLNSLTSVQLLGDRMRMDQDYTPESIFTLEQRQRSAGITQEFIITPERSFGHWRPQSGFFCFGKLNRMDAPVLFKEDGIRSLILDNANRNIPEEYGYLDISEKSFPVNSRFLLGSWNAALFHESVWVLGRWVLTAGIRFDYEGGYMHYNSDALIHYRFVPIMTEAKEFKTSYTGHRLQHFFEVLPKISALYSIPVSSGSLRVYGNVSKGFRSGGFNTQIFSDILQGLMMNGMMEDLGVYLDNPREGVSAGNTQYKPEEAWNYEIGLRFSAGGRLTGQVDAYYIDCLHQQLTVFPPGKTTGRMMTNAGRSRSIGAEAELDYRHSGFHSHLSYSYCDARFREYIDGNADYSGNRIPYVPLHSYYFEVDDRFPALGLTWTVSGELRGSGPIYWNEDNSRSSGATIDLGATLGVSWGNCRLYLRGENLLGRQHPAFYFKSIGNEFFAVSKPRRLTLGITYII